MNAGTFQTFLNRLRPELGRLPHSHQVAFGASCCERAYPNYVLFAAQEGWGDAVALRSALDTAWMFVLSGGLAEANRTALLKKCKAATPDSNGFNPATESAAVVITAGQEATFMVTLLLEFCGNPDPGYGVRIAAFARDTVDRQAQVLDALISSEPHLEQELDRHPLVLQELQKQEDDLASLKQARESLSLKEFVQRVSSPPRSNTGVVSQRPN